MSYLHGSESWRQNGGGTAHGSAGGIERCKAGAQRASSGRASLRGGARPAGRHGARASSCPAPECGGARVPDRESAAAGREEQTARLRAAPVPEPTQARAMKKVWASDGQQWGASQHIRDACIKEPSPTSQQIRDA